MNLKTIKTILTNSYQNDRLSHAYLFFGKRGTLKFETALELASLVLGEDAKDSLNCYIINHDEKTIKKDEVKDLLQEFSLTSTNDKYRFAIINHAEKLNASSENSLLKFIEEPTAKTIIILITDSINKILDTIKSRCFLLNFDYDDFESFKNILSEKTSDIKLITLLFNLTSNASEATSYLESEDFKNLLNLVSVTVINPIKGLYENYRSKILTKDNINLFLDLLLNAYTLSLSGVNYFEINKMSLEDISSNLDLILDTKRRLDFNVSFDLTIDLFFSKLK